MESRVSAPMDGVVHQVLTKPGAQVEAGTALVVLTSAGPTVP
jgi:urea carboxylase